MFPLIPFKFHLHFEQIKLFSLNLKLFKLFFLPVHFRPYILSFR